MQQPLLLSRRFFPIFSAMALCAFNDNYYKNALIILITYILAKQQGMPAEMLISIASAFFILPFFLFSGLGGMLADKHAKYKLVRILKVTELLLVIAAGAALLSHHMTAMIAILFLLGTQAAFFGPVKYAILPELLAENELMHGNGMVEAATFLAILLGTILGGLLVMRDNGPLIVAASLIFIAVLGVISAWAVPITQPGMPELSISRNPFVSLWHTIRFTITKRELMAPIVGISWFWTIGVTYLTQLSVFTKQVIGGNEEIVTLYSALFSIGIALGSLSCQYLAKRVKRVASLSLLGLCLFGLDMVWAGFHTTPARAMIGLGEYPLTFHYLRIAIDLFLMAACGGIFTIPLYTRLQLAGGVQQRARAIASNNIANALFVALASVLTVLLYGMGLHVTHVLLGFTLANIPIIALLWARRI